MALWSAVESHLSFTQAPVLPHAGALLIFSAAGLYGRQGYQPGQGELSSVSLAGASRRIPGFNLRVLSPTLALLPLYQRFRLFRGHPERN